MRWYERPAVVAAILALGVAVVLQGCWSANFYYLDDPDHVLAAAEQPVSELLLAGRGPCFPAALLSYRLDYALAGPEHPRDAMKREAARGWATEIRLMNGVYHLLAGLLLYFFLLRLGATAAIALGVAFAWVAHPMACESVCWIAERKSVLAGAFGFGALLAWTADRTRWWRWPLVCALFALAMASKASALGLFPVLLCLESIDPRERQFDYRYTKCWARAGKRLFVPLLLTIAGACYSSYAFKYDVVAPPGGSAGTALLTDAAIFARYIQHIFVPANLSFYYYVEPIRSIADVRFWSALAALALPLFALWKLTAARQRPLALFGIAWFFAALAQNSNLVASAFPMQDRFTYLAAPGLLLAFFLALSGAAQRWRAAHWPAQLAALGFPVLIAGFALARSPLFASNEALDLDAAERQPQSAYAQVVAANVKKARAFRHLPGEREADPAKLTECGNAALTHYRRALECPDAPNFANVFEIRVREAELAIMLGRFAEARDALDGWLPPPGMNVLQPGQHYTRPEHFHGYTQVLLAHAWALRGEADLRESQAEGTQPAAGRALCEAGLAALNRSLAIDPNHAVGIRKVHLLLHLSELETASGSLTPAREHFDAATALLKRMTAVPELADTARELLGRISRP